MKGLHPIAEPLGERILYSADAAALVPDAALLMPGNQDENTPLAQANEFTQNQISQAQENNETAPTLVVLDPDLEDLDLLIADLQAQADDQSPISYLVLSAEQDGVEQVTEALADSEQPYGSIQILSHGEAGRFDLGAASISSVYLTQNPGAFEAWRDYLTESADLLLYGCDLSQTSEGLALIALLSDATGADVAASDDTTGHSSLGGDWTLESETGAIESSLALSDAAANAWLATLDAVSASAPDQVNATLLGAQQFDNLTGARQIASNGSSVVVVWTDATNGNVSFQRYDINGVKQGSELAIANPLNVTRSSPAISMNASGEFVITWTSAAQDGDGAGIYAQRFQADGTPYGQPASSLSGTFSNPNEFRVSRETVSDQQTPDVAFYDDGRFIITWQSLDNIAGNLSTNIRYALFDSAGTHITTIDEFASTDSTTNQLTPVVAIENSNGTAIIAFEKEDLAGTDQIVFRQIGADGVAIGGSATSIGSVSPASRPSIAMNDSGRFVIGWNETIIGIDSSWMTVFASDLSPFTTQLVAPVEFTDQPNGKVDIDAQGNLVGVWQNNGSGDFDVYARQFNAEGVAVGGRLLLSTDNTGDQVTPDVVIHGSTASAVYAGESSTDAAGIVLTRFSFAPVGAVVTLPTPQETAENGSVVTLRLALLSQPQGDVTVTATVSDTSEAALVQSTHTFNTANWSADLPFQLQPVDDLLTDGDVPYTVTFSFTSAADSNYEALPDQVYDFVSLDDEVAPAPVGPVTDSDINPNTIDENSAALTNVGITAGATDPNAGDTVTYSISNDPSGFFEINSTTGVVRLAAGANLNATSNPLHTIQVQATSSDTSTSQTDFDVTVTSAPQSIGSISDSDPAANQIAEDDAGNTAVGFTALATDANSADSVTYSIVSDPSGAFVIDGASGVVSTNGSPNLNFENNQQHDIRVRATSSDTSFAELDVTIAVTDVNETLGAQTDVDPSGDRISEASPALTPVGITASATDPDPADTVSYAMNSDPSGNFEVDAVTGVVRLRAGATLDALANPTHTIVVRATSTDLSSADQSYLIQVDSSNSSIGAITDIDGSGNQVAENVADGTRVGLTARAVDPDSVDTVSYSITIDASGFFEIDSVNGIVAVAPGASLDYENATQHTIQIQALSSDGSTSLANPVINILDVNEALTITSNGGGASADIQLANNEQNVTVVQAQDPESVAPTYSIAGGVDAGLFSIDGGTGQLTFDSAPDVGSPTDANGDSVYEVTVQASDGLNLATQSLRVGIAVNPAGSPIGALSDSDGAINQVNENSAGNTPVGVTANANDPDLNDSVSYSIISDPSANFQIDSASGVVSVSATANLDFESASQHTVRVRATSSDASFTDANFLISVNNLPETPVITSNGGGGLADITLADGDSSVTTVQATDPDNQGITYSITGGSDAALFTIVSNTGELRFTTPPDLSNPGDSNLNSVYLVNVRASDGAQFDDQIIRVGVGVSPNSPDAGWSGPVSLNEDQQIVLNNAMLFIDPSNAPVLRIDLSIEAGSFSLGQINGLTFIQGNGTADNAMSFTGTPADVIAALSQVTYQPLPNDTNNPLASFKVSDANDPTKYDLALNRFQISAVNDAPVINGSLLTQSVNDQPVVINTDILSANDPDDPSDTSLVFTIQSVPTSGVLTIDGSPLSGGQTFDLSDIASGRLAYVANQTTATQDTFSISAADASGAASVVSSVTIQRITVDAPSLPEPDDNNGSGSQTGETVGSETDEGTSEDNSNSAAADTPAEISTPGNTYSRTAQGSVSETNALSDTPGMPQTIDKARLMTDRGAALAFAVSYETATDASVNVRYELPASDLLVQRDYRIDQIGFSNSKFQRGLASLQDDFQLASSAERSVVASSIAVSSGLSIGYVLWLLRSGALLSSVLASIPAWRSIDPLPILSSMPAADGQAGDDDSLESMLARADEQRQKEATQTANAEPTDS